MTIVTKPLDATLINHTGTMVRFRRGDLQYLPAGRQGCEIELPDGRVVTGRFGPNRENPNVTGRLLTQWIKSLLPRTETCHVVIHPVGNSDKIRLELPAGPTSIPRQERSSLLARAPRSKGLPTERKRQVFERWERDPRLGRFVRDVWGTRCQVVDCTTQDVVGSGPDVERLVDVHHLQSVSAGGDDSPANLVVLCMMHHGLMHRAPLTPRVSTSANTVQVTIGRLKMDIVRDLEQLNRAMSWHP